jgi:uncharacterized glyoxalase superfamily protein PhnB
MPEAKAPTLEAAVPILSVSDLGKALDYYEGMLKFTVDWLWGDPAHLAGVSRDRVELNLSLSSDPNRGISRVYFQMDGVDAYYLDLTRAGVEVAVPLADRPYGMRDFRIVDPSGNELSFGEAIAP